MLGAPVRLLGAVAGVGSSAAAGAAEDGSLASLWVDFLLTHADEADAGSTAAALGLGHNPLLDEPESPPPRPATGGAAPQPGGGRDPRLPSVRAGPAPPLVLGAGGAGGVAAAAGGLGASRTAASGVVGAAEWTTTEQPALEAVPLT